jgi:ankyrin repeat protein
VAQWDIYSCSKTHHSHIYESFGSTSKRTGTTQNQSIEAAVRENDVAFVEQWLSDGGNPDYVDNQRQSLLYLATGSHGGLEVMDVLLEAGANPDLGLVASNYTPLMNASSWVNLAAVDELLEAGADPTLKNSSGQTALETVGNAKGAEQEVIRRLEAALEEAN